MNLKLFIVVCFPGFVAAKQCSTAEREQYEHETRNLAPFRLRQDLHRC